MAVSSSMPGERITFPRHLLFFLSFLLIFIYSLSPSVYAGDSGLFTSASYFLGSAHHPGYPLYILLGKLVTFIPFGNIALKINLLSVLFGALTVLLAYDTAFYITKNRIISIFAPLTILTSANFIFESSKAEAYTLNVFLIMLIFYLGLRAVKEKDCFKPVLAASFILGLGMGNHHTIGFMLFVIFYVIMIRRRTLPSGTIALSAVLFVTGFSVYLFLFLRAHADAFINYSRVYSPADFLMVFFRTGYSGNTLNAIGGIASSGIGWLYAIKNVGAIMLRNMHPLIWLFVLSGMVSFVRDKKVFGYISVSIMVWLLLAKMTASAGNMTHNDFSIVTPYFLQLVPIFGVIAAAGLYKSYGILKAHSAIISKAVVAGLIIFQVVFVSVAVQRSSLSDYFIAYSWIKDVSKVLKPKSVYLAYGDNPGFLGFYGFGVERLRDDVLHMDARTGAVNFRLTLSPERKFSMWYPEFYKAQRTSLRYFYPAAEKGRLHSSMIGSVPQDFKDKLDTKWYVLGSILLPKNSKFSYEERFKHNFRKIDYLPVIIGYKEDMMAEEILKTYMFTVWEYANFLAADNAEDTDYYYRLAVRISKNRQYRYEIIEDHVKFIVEKKGVQEAEKFIAELKNALSGADPETEKAIESIEELLRMSDGNERKN